MSNQEVVNAWIEGRTGNAGTLATGDGCLWSYAALIGHIFSSGGRMVCCITTCKHSKTTSCHTSAARRAAEAAGYKVETL